MSSHLREVKRGFLLIGMEYAGFVSSMAKEDLWVEALEPFDERLIVPAVKRVLASHLFGEPKLAHVVTEVGRLHAVEWDRRAALERQARDLAPRAALEAPSGAGRATNVRIAEIIAETRERLSERSRGDCAPWGSDGPRRAF